MTSERIEPDWGPDIRPPNPKVHWHGAQLTWMSGISITNTQSVFFGHRDKVAPIHLIDKAAEEVGIPKVFSIGNVFYMGYMTIEEFQGIPSPEGDDTEEHC